jgi:hypothetical protein
MFIRPGILAKKKQACSARQQDAATCNCTERCSGYASRVNCPPLIVLAVLATQATVSLSKAV